MPWIDPHALDSATNEIRLEKTSYMRYERARAVFFKELNQKTCTVYILLSSPALTHHTGWKLHD